MKTLIVDRGGTSTKVGNKKFPSDLPRLVPKLKIYLKSLHEKPKEAIVGSRGVWTKQERLALQKKLSFLAPRVTVVSDIELAHLLAFGNSPGIVLNAGTGSIAYGRNEKGKTARAGGWGPLVGDEGSAFWVGREFLKRTNQFERLRKLMKDKEGVKKMASYAKVCFKNSSPIAQEIRKEAVEHLKILITKLQSILKTKKPTPVALRGGLFENPRFRTALTRQLRKLRFHV